MRWKIKQPSEDHVASLKKEFNTSEIIAKVLANRGIESLKSFSIPPMINSMTLS